MSTIDAAAALDGLPVDRRKRLIEYVRQLTADLGEESLEPRLVRSAALLIRSREVAHVAVPVAVAQAQAVERLPLVGTAIQELLESLLRLDSEHLERISANRGAVQILLQECSRELTRLARRLEPQSSQSVRTGGHSG